MMYRHREFITHLRRLRKDQLPVVLAFRPAKYSLLQEYQSMTILGQNIHERA